MFKKVRRIVNEYCTAIYNKLYNRPMGYVWMFHRVAPVDGALPIIDELRVSPQYFRNFLLDKINRGGK